MKKNIQRLLFFAILLLPLITQAQDTCETIGYLPYFNDFENEPFNSGITSTPGSTSAMNAFPQCWVRINDGTGNRYFPFITSESNYVINGSKSMSWSHSTYNNYAENEYAVLPPIDQNIYDSLISNLSMSFVARTTAWIAPFPIFIVGVMHTPTDTASFVAVDTITLSNTATLYTVDFANYTGSGKYLAIRFPRNGLSRQAMLDDVFLNLTREWCNPPTNLSAHSTDSEVTLTWNANGNSSFTVNLGDFTVNGVTDTFYTFNNLHDSTLYNYSVASECPSGNSIFITGSIQTECHPLTYDDLPFVEDFEIYGTASNDPISPCWHRGIVGYYYNSILTRLCRFEIDNDTVGLSLGASCESPYNYSSWVALPRLADTVDVSNLEINFLIRRPNTGVMPIALSCMVVGVSSDITDDASFVTVDTINVSSEPVNSITPITVRFENYTGSGKYIVLKAVVPPSDSPGTSVNSTTSCTFAIDNVILQLTTPCPTPQNVQVTGATATSVNAVWNFDYHADSCFVYIGTPGFSIDTATPLYVWHSSSTITDNIVGATVDSLTPDTEYEIIIAASCNGTLSYGSHPVLFRTLCAPIDILPFYEDFESVEGLTSIYYYGVNIMPPCWQYYNEGIASEGTGYPRVHNNPSYAHSGNNALRFNTHNSQTPPDYTVQNMYYTDQIAIMPITDSTLYPLSNLLVSFWSHVGENNNCSMIVEVGVMIDPFDTSTFIPVSTITHYNANYFDFNVVGFANYTGPHGHVAFKAPLYTPLSHAGANQFYIDDITLEEIPNSCPPISAIHAEATASAARLTWDFSTEFGTPTGFEVSYRYADDPSAPLSYITTTEPEAILTGLGPDSSYWASVAAECNGLYGGADTIIVHTLDLPCVDWDTTDIQGDTLILGNPGTGTTYMFPVNAMTASSKVQHLFLASEIPVNGPTTLKGIGFDYAYNMPAVWAANCTIWLAHTTVDSMSNSFVSGQQLVYEGSLAFSEPGWNYVLFNQGLFEYDGVSNLCITIEKNWNNPANTNYTFRYETTEDHNMTCWGYRTPRPVGAYIMSTISNNMRSNTRIITSGDVYCGRWATCMPPIIHVDSSIIGSYRLFWVPGYHETSWNVYYRIADTGTWITAISETTVNEYTITMSELEYNTRYEFRVTSNCSDTAVSDTISFYSSCTYIDIPFYYDFDGLPLGSSTEPADIHCWTHLNNGRIYNGSPYITTYAHSGNRGLSFFGSPGSGYGDYGIMVLPPVDTAENPINSLYLNFWAKTPSAKIYVGVMTDPTDVNTYTPVDTVVVEHDDNQWDLLEASFNNYVGEGQYIALRTNRGDGGGMIDDITVTDRPICRRVHNIKVRNVTTDSATISWTRGYEESAWELTVGDRIFYLTDTFFNVHELVSDTPYDIVVRSICDEGDTSVPTFGFFHTPCFLLDTLPYINDLENEPFYSWTMGEGTNYYYAFPACWRRLHDKRTATNYNYHHPYVCSANNYLIHGDKSLYWERESNGNAYVVLPPVDLGVFRMDSLYLSFYAKNTNNVSGAPTQLIVGALANSSDTTSFEPVDTITLTNTNTLYTVRFNNYTGTNNYIAICLPQYNNERNVSIDDIYLTNHWCDAPSNLISTATATDVTLSWNGNGVSSFTIFLTADSVVYDPVNDVTYTVPGATDTITGVTDTVYTFHNLSDSTVYNYIVATECFGALGMSLTGSIQTECYPMVYDELPYYEDFEAYGNHYQSSISRCWHRGGSPLINGYQQPKLTTSFLDADTVGLSFSASSMNNSFCWASLPQLDESVNISDLEINLLIKRPTSGYTPIPNTTLVVGVSTDIYSWYSSAPLESSDFVPVDTIDFSDEPVNTIHNATVRFDNYTGNGKYIVLMAPEPASTTTNSNGFTIDNITLNFANPCHIPEHVTVTHTTWDSVYATWDGDSNVNSWTLYIGAPGSFSNDSWMSSGNILTYQLVNNYAAIGNLNPNTDYEMVVVASCSGNESNATFPVQFHTLCSPIDNLPFTEDFESVAGIPSYTTYAPGNTLPDCWLRYNSSIANTSFPLVHNDAAIAHSGTNAIYFATSNNSGSSTDLIAIMPVTDATLFPIWNLQVSFWMRCAHGYNSYIVVGVMSDPTDTNTFVAIDTVYTYSIELHNNTMVYSEHTVSFANYTGPHGNVAFKAPRVVHTLVGVNSPYIDDITIKELPCSSADNLRTLSIGADSITIAWGDTSNASIYWYVEYDTVEFTPGTGSVTPISVTDTVFTLTGLDSGTVYHIYVYPNCPDSVSYSYLCAFTLLSTPSSVPYASDFEDSGSNGWVLINGSQVNYWMVGNVTGNPGSSLYITDDGSSNSYSGYTSTVFATRTLQFDSVGEYAYSFDWKCNGEGGYDYLQAALVNAQTALTPGKIPSFDSQSSIFTSPQFCQRNAWQSPSGSFSITSPGNYVWLFMWHNDSINYNQAPAAIDNFKLIPNTCPLPRNVSGDFSANRIILTWNPGGTETEWEVSLGSSSVIVNTPTYTFTDLSPTGSYTVHIRSICGDGDTSLAVTAMFTPRRYRVTTSANNPAFGMVSGDGMYYYGDIATLTATPNTGYIFTEWNDGDTLNPKNITVTSDTIMTAFFDVEQEEGIDNPQLSNADCRLSIIPNPAKGTTTVSIAGISGKIRISLLDMTGREIIGEVYSIPDSHFSIPIDIKGLPSGAYFVRITSESHAPLVKKLIIR